MSNDLNCNEVCINMNAATRVFVLLVCDCFPIIPLNPNGARPLLTGAKCVPTIDVI